MMKTSHLKNRATPTALFSSLDFPYSQQRHPKSPEYDFPPPIYVEPFFGLTNWLFSFERPRWKYVHRATRNFKRIGAFRKGYYEVQSVTWYQIVLRRIRLHDLYIGSRSLHTSPGA